MIYLYCFLELFKWLFQGSQIHANFSVYFESVLQHLKWNAKILHHVGPFAFSLFVMVLVCMTFIYTEKFIRQQQSSIPFTCCLPFILLLLLFFKSQVSFWYHFPSLSITSFSNSFRAGLLALNSLSFPSPVNIFLLFLLLKIPFFARLKSLELIILFLSTLKMLFHFLQSPWFLIRNVSSFESFFLIIDHFPLAILKIFFVFCFQQLNMCLGVNFFGFILFGIH